MSGACESRVSGSLNKYLPATTGSSGLKAASLGRPLSTIASYHGEQLSFVDAGFASTFDGRQLFSLIVTSRFSIFD